MHVLYLEHYVENLTSVRVIALVLCRVTLTTGRGDPVWMLFILYC